MKQLGTVESADWYVAPRRACAARVTVVVLCVCVCVQAAHLRLTQLSDKLDILTDLVSWWLQHEFGVFRLFAEVRAFVLAHGASTLHTQGVRDRNSPTLITACA